jgi:3-hydroxyisobutyrate dehydrogenase-like beta-hydroxyacid dehydrogenase
VDTAKKPTIAFVGAGQMGEPMVERLVDDGMVVRVYARRAEVRERLRARGAQLATSLDEAATGADVAVVCTFDDAELQEVSLGAGGLIAAMPPGSVLASHTTGTIATIERLAGAGADRGVRVVDAPISGAPSDVRAGQLTVLIGGDEASSAVVESAVRPYASTVVRAGPLGSALKIKLVNNLLFSANLQAAARAVALGRELGIAPEVLTAAIQHCSGHSEALRRSGTSSVEDLGRSIGPFLVKDIRSAAAVARGLGVDISPLIALIEQGPIALAARASAEEERGSGNVGST